MANREIRYSFRCTTIGGDAITFSSVDDAKSKILFFVASGDSTSSWDWTYGTPSWTLEDSNRRLVLTWVFTDDQADDQLTCHTNVKNGTWLIAGNNSTTHTASFEDDQCYYKQNGVIRAKVSF
jgi:hypothetical protein